MRATPASRPSRPSRPRRRSTRRAAPAKRASSQSGFPKSVRFGSHPATIRLLGPADAGRLIDFFRTHSPETVHLRYGYLFTEMTPERAAELVGVDQTRDFAVGVFERGRGASRIVAIGRYCLADDARSAEVAFVVHEERRRLGIATGLLDIMASVARDRGLKRLTATVQRDNRPMVAVFERARAVIAPLAGVSNALSVEIRLSGARR